MTLEWVRRSTMSTGWRAYSEEPISVELISLELMDGGGLGVRRLHSAPSAGGVGQLGPEPKWLEARALVTGHITGPVAGNFCDP